MLLCQDRRGEVATQFLGKLAVINRRPDRVEASARSHNRVDAGLERPHPHLIADVTRFRAVALDGLLSDTDVATGRDADRWILKHANERFERVTRDSDR